MNPSDVIRLNAEEVRRRSIKLWEGIPADKLDCDELNFSAPFHQQYLDFLATLTGDDLTSLKVDRSEVGYVRAAGDFLLRAAYHEAVHAGQLLDYFRTMGVARPSVWD